MEKVPKRRNKSIKPRPSDEIKFYVVKIKHSNKKLMNEIKKQLCETFGGITIIQNCEGLWLNEENIESDKVEVWESLTAKENVKPIIQHIAKKLKAVGKQKSQLYAINDKPYFV